MLILDWLIGDTLIYLVLIIVLCSVLVAGIRFIKSKGGKALFIVVVGTAIGYLILRLV